MTCFQKSFSECCRCLLQKSVARAFGRGPVLCATRQWRPPHLCSDPWRLIRGLSEYPNSQYQDGEMRRDEKEQCLPHLTSSWEIGIYIYISYRYMIFAGYQINKTLKDM